MNSKDEWKGSVKSSYISGEKMRKEREGKTREK
jgi:hypothetical protein